MRIVSTHLTLLERQVQESCNIIKAMQKQEECLNRNSEWEEAKLPGISVLAPREVVQEDFGKGEGEEDGRKSGENLEEGKQERAEESLILGG